jgi:transposase
MSAERLSMRKLREVLRLHFENNLSGRAIARSVGASCSTVSGYTWPLPDALADDLALTQLLFPDENRPRASRPDPDWAWVHLELKKRHVTKSLLWEEYRAKEPAGYQYSRFCELYERWARRLNLTMRQAHRAGEKMFVDFSGDGLDVVEPATGECRAAKLFIAVLGASNFTYVEPVLGEDLPTWVGCHVRALEFFGGSAELWIPDNLKSGVTRPSRYEPDLNPTYAELSRHYGAAIIPARVRKPRDKAKVEQAVLLAERWILAALRNQTFFSLEDVRQAVKPLLEKLNSRVMRKLRKSRRELFEELERAALKPLPKHPYEFARWARPRVHIDYHVEFDDHFYSVPYQLVGTQVDLRATETAIEVFLGGRRVTSHQRSYERAKYTTRAEHMPKGHRELAEWTPTRLVAWAKKTGPATAAVVEEILRRRVHPQQGFKACLGILSLERRYEGRVEAACLRALQCRAFSYRSVANILKNNLDRAELPEAPQQRALPLHENIRGADYYQ